MGKVAQRRKAKKTKALGEMVGANFTGHYVPGWPVLPENRATRRMQEQAAKRAAKKIT